MKRSMMLFFCVAVLLSLPLLATAQQALNNEAIVKLVKAGLSEDLIVGMVNNQPGNYSLGADDVIALKQAGVSDKIIAAIVAKGAARMAPSTGVVSSPRRRPRLHSPRSSR